MTNSGNTDPLTRLECEALDLVQHLMSGSATVENLEAAKRWQSQSPAHAAAISAARGLWTRLGPVGRDVWAGDSELVSSRSGLLQPVGSSRRALLGGAAAAAAAMAGYAIIRPPLELWPSLAELSADYRTGTGEQRQITLASGLTVALNTQTSIATHAGNDRRAGMDLISGEAVISAEHAQLDQVVGVGDGRISFRNARLNIRYDGRSLCTITCLQGSARVERLGAVAELGPDQDVAYSERGLGSPEPADPDVTTAWQKGLLIFHQAPLSEVIAEINRYRRGKIILLNAALGRRAVNARFTLDGVDDIIVLARRELGATVTSLPGGVVLLT